MGAWFDRGFSLPKAFVCRLCARAVAMVWSWLQVLPTLPSPRTKEYAAFARRLSNGVTADTQFSGSKMFPTCLYYTHHRPGYFTSVHMNGESTLNAGAPTLFRSRMEPA